MSEGGTLSCDNRDIREVGRGRRIPNRKWAALGMGIPVPLQPEGLAPSAFSDPGLSYRQGCTSASPPSPAPAMQVGPRRPW